MFWKVFKMVLPIYRLNKFLKAFRKLVFIILIFELPKLPEFQHLYNKTNNKIVLYFHKDRRIWNLKIRKVFISRFNNWYWKLVRSYQATLTLRHSLLKISRIIRYPNIIKPNTLPIWVKLLYHRKDLDPHLNNLLINPYLSNTISR